MVDRSKLNMHVEQVIACLSPNYVDTLSANDLANCLCNQDQNITVGELEARCFMVEAAVQHLRTALGTIIRGDDGKR